MSKIKCDHCHLEFEPNVMIEDEGRFFCCKGCQGVYHLLNSSGLDSFYDKVGNKKLAPPIEDHSDTSKFDSESFHRIYISQDEHGFSKINLIIEGIHCAACVWLNEKVLNDADGIVEANINFSNNKATIIWDEDKITLSHIIEKIRSIGYNAYPYDIKSGNKKLTSSKRDYFIRMMVAVFGAMNIMMLGVAKYSGFFTGIDEDVRKLIHLAEFIFTTPVLFYSGWLFFKGAYFGLKNRVLNMDFLVATGATLTYIYSLLILFGMKGESYFDSVTMIITFVLVGKYLEVIGKNSAVDTLDTIKNQLPSEATIVVGDEKKLIAADEVKIGDIVEIKSGEKAVVDGVVVDGSANFDESSLTGESIPVYKKIGDKIYSGTINSDSLLHFKATKDYNSSTLNSIISLIEDALASKPKIEKTANEISKYFSAAILFIAVMTFLGWYFIGGTPGFDMQGNRFETAFIITVSVIVIACPCALALATPIASLIGIGTLSKRGLLFKEASFIETIAKADTLVLDKTGTITEGHLEVIESNLKNDLDLDLLYSLVESSNHPVSVAVKNHLLKNHKDLKRVKLSEFKTLQAKGVCAKTEDETLLVGGNEKVMREFGIKIDESFNTTLFLFAIGNKIAASFKLEDKIKENTKETIAKIKDIGIDVVMLTGDHQNAAKKIASEAGIENYQADMTPEEKADFISKLKNEGKTIMMVGDGINDSLALSRSDIAIAMGSGADIAIEVSDVVILNSSIKSLYETFFISRRTYYFIKENLALSLIYNLITIPLAVMGYVIPLVAALSMSLSSLIVVGNSMRIKNIKKD
jgi:Cu+-exporting ATPase